MPDTAGVSDVPLGSSDPVLVAGLFDCGALSPSRISPQRLLLQLAVTTWIQLKIVVTDPFTGVLQVLWPLFFATGAFLVYRQSEDPVALVYAALGASAMGIWSAIATNASNALQRERWLGTLELLVTTPTRLALILMPMSLALASLGLTSLLATLLWGVFVFDVELTIADPLGFAVAVVGIVVAIALVGFLLSVAVVRYRTAWALGNLLEYPGWLLCGFLVPVDLLPEQAAWISKILPPTWGMAAVRDAAAGISPWGDLALALGLACAYALVAALVAERLLSSARRHATLALT